jgi:ABC-2 type transport system permease protein
MKEIIVVFKSSIKRSLPVLVLTLAMGLLLPFIFNAMTSLHNGEFSGVPVGFISNEDTVITKDLKNYLSNELKMQLFEDDSIDALNTELIERHIAGIISLPSGFSKAILNQSKMAIEVVFLDDYENAAFIEGYLQNYMQTLKTLAGAAGGSEEELALLLNEMQSQIPVIQKSQSDPELQLEQTQKEAFNSVIGFYMMFAFFSAFIISNQLFDDRKMGLYNRIRATNILTVQYFTGIGLTGLVCSIIQIVPLIAFIIITNPSIGISLWQIFALSLAYIFFVIAFSIMAALYLASKNALLAVIIGVGSVTCMLGGAYFPIETAPAFMQQLSKFTPQYWFTSAVGSIQENNSSSFLLNIAVILLFAVLLFIIAGIRHVNGKMRKI